MIGVGSYLYFILQGKIERAKVLALLVYPDVDKGWETQITIKYEHPEYDWVCNITTKMLNKTYFLSEEDCHD